MADATQKITIFFETFGKRTNFGWTETFYGNFAALDSASFQIRTGYIPSRVALLGVGARAKYIRVASVANKRQTFVDYLTGGKGEGQYYIHDPVDDVDLATTDLLIRMQTSIADGSKRRQFWMSGLPDEVTDTGQESGIKNSFLSDGRWVQYQMAIFNLNLTIRFILTPKPELSYSNAKIAFITPVEVRKRNRGRPFNQFRGRKLV